MIVDCTTHFFIDPPHCSNLHLTLPFKVTRIRDHPITDLAGASFATRKYKSDHENVQMHLIASDPETIAAEIPVWIGPDEVGSYGKYVQPTGVLSGHIDLIRFSEGFVEIWDYKPGAFQETFAAGQVLFYALMLSKRTS